MSEWKTYKLGDVATVQTGPFGSQLHQADYVNDGTPIITVEHLGENRILHSNLPRVTDEDRIRLRKYWLQEGDIVFSRVGSVDRRAYVKDLEDGWLFSGRCLRVRPINEFTDGKYLSYFFGLEEFKTRIRAVAVGATMPSLNTSIMSNIEVRLPNIETQKEIAQILSSLDDKIELNLQMNQTLEAMAQAIFKEWFVNFNFPGFDGELVDGLPKGWRLGVLGELVEKLSKGTTPTQKDLGSLEVQIPFLKVKDISDNGTIIKTNLELIPIEVHQNLLKRSVLQTDDILFSIAGTIGRVAILDYTLNNSNCNQAIAFIRLREKSKYLEYVHQWLKSETVQNNIKSSIVQGVQANVSLTVLSNIDIVIPDDTTIEHWNSLIKPTYSRLLMNTHQIENLTQTRDTLLPKLMSGQLELAI